MREAPFRRILGAFAVFITLAAGARAVELDELERTAFREAADNVAPSVVQIRTIGGLDQIDQKVLAQGPTTGLVVSADGYIVSSAFNFAQQPASVLVRLPDGTQKPAEIVGRDDNRMLVLLKVETDSPLPVPTPSPLGELRVGDWTIAVGRTFQTEQVDVSVGVVSALGRMLGRVVQSDVNASPANYGGALVDIEGRVIGVLVPMSPEPPTAGAEASAIAGAEYYDSGIAFAVPLEHVLAILPRWIEQKELKRGLLGVGFIQGSPHATAAEVAAVWPRSPAADAGWKKGDVVTAVDGRSVESQTQLRIAVVPHYAGDKIHVTLRRPAKADGKAKEIESGVTLAGKLEPYRHAFLGVLPGRGEDAKGQGDGEVASGVRVRAAWPGSPAAKAGFAAGDRVTKLGEAKIASVDEALAELNAKNPGEKVAVEALRTAEGKEQTLKLDVELADLPTEILAASDLGATTDQAADEGADQDDVKLEELTLPEFEQPAYYVAPSKKGVAPGLFLWLGDRKKEASEAFAKAWGDAIARERFVLLMPTPGDKAGWSSEDGEYLGRLLRTACAQFAVDPQRVVVGGEGKGGQLAYALAFRGRALIRGAAVVDAPLPRTLDLPENVPSERLAILTVQSQNAPWDLLVRQDVAKLRGAGYPVSEFKGGEPAKPDRLDPVQRAAIERWMAGLDRF